MKGPVSERAARALFRALDRTVPQFAARLAMLLFMLPPKAPRRHLISRNTGNIATTTDREQQLCFSSGGRRLSAQLVSPPAVREPQTILLLHGWGGHGGQFSGLIEPLVGAGFRVVTPDLPAHGRSRGRVTNAFEMRQAVLDLVTHVGQPHAVIAHSFGAMVTALALNAGLTPEACALVAPMTSFEYAVNAFSTALGLSPRARTRMLQHLEAKYAISSAGMEVAETASTRDLPLLVVHDTDDTRVPLEMGQALAEAWPGAELRVTSGLGHHRVLKDAAVVDTLVRFVSERLSRESPA